MRFSKHIFSFAICLFFLLQSCSVEKRHYLGGYFFSHRKLPHGNVAAKTNSTTGAHPQKAINDPPTISNQNKKEGLIASASNENGIVTDFQEIILPLATDTCDTIVLRNEIEIKAKVLEITPKIIRYKHCDSPAGPTYTIPVKDVILIKYKNGTRDEFKYEEPTATQIQPGHTTDDRIRRQSNMALIFGILAFPLTVLYVVGIIFAIMAITIGSSALRMNKYDTSPYAASRKTIAKAGLILGIVYLALLVFLLLALIAALAGFFIM